MQTAQHQPGDPLPHEAGQDVAAGRSLQAMRHRLARATGVGFRRGGPNTQVDLLGLTAATLASIVQSSAGTVQAA